MNRNLHRIIFSASRGCRMVVAETARSLGKAAQGECSATVKKITLALACAILPMTLQAQVVADPTAPGSTRPQVVNTANGLPQVIIQTPSAAGVSRNIYSQFDVGSQGAILNNASANVQSQLGGWVQANANLAAGSARVILNEVNSTNPSQLRGFVEVAGQRAEVIIANPAGITVNGGGFINASAVTLSTGAAQMNAGSLDGHRVTQGSVSVQGAGLDTRSADYTRILARAVQVNAGIWAKDLSVVTGANQVSADASTGSATTGSGAAPLVALDVASIGGMYAHKIRLIGTEAGLGVNNAGTLAASSGDLVLDVNGTLTNRGVLDAQTTNVQATSIQNTGTGRIYGDHVALQADALDNSAETIGGVTRAAVIAARSRLDIGAQSLTNSEHALILSAGDMAVGGTLDASLQATGSATSLRNASATIEALGAVNISADTLTNANDHFAYGEQLISTQTGLYEAPWADYYRTFDRYFYEPVVSQDDPGQIIAGGNMVLWANTITNQQSKIIAGGTLTATGTSINNTTVSADNRVNDVGTQYSWGVTGGHSKWDWGWHWVLDYGYVPSAYNVNTLTSATVSQGVSMPNASAGSVSTTPARSSVTAPASATASALASALFNTPTNPSATYLIETDPRFTNQRTWLGSDYMLTSLALDPAAIQKRLGDGFYEQRLIREQVSQLTGRRFLGNYTSDEAQYVALMNAGVTTAQAFNLRPGIALTAEQVAQLTSDIVWLVEKELTLPDGRKERALVPQLYAMARAGDVDATGALLSGRSVQLAANGNVFNSGVITAQQLGMSADNVQNTRGNLSAGQLDIRTTGDISNTSGTISAGQSLELAAGGNITSTTATREVGGANRTSLDRQARIEVTGTGGTLDMRAEQDITLTASQVQSAGTAQITTAGSVKLEAATTQETFHRESHGEAEFVQHLEQSTQAGSSVQSAGNLNISAGRDITATAAAIGSGANTGLRAANNILLQAGQNTSSSDLRWVQTNSSALSRTTTDTQTQYRSATAQRSTLSGQNVTVTAGNTLASVGTAFKGVDILQVEGKEQTLLYEAQDVQTSSTNTRSTTSLGGFAAALLSPLGFAPKLEDKTSTDSSASSTAIGTRLVSNQKIEVGVGAKTELRGAELDAQQIAFIQTDPTKAGELILGSSTNTTQTAYSENSETLGLYQQQKGAGSTTQNLNQTQLKGNVQFDAALKITAQIPDTQGGQALKSQINTLVSQGTGLEYLNTLAANPNVKWDQVALAHEQWSYDQAGLTPAGAALLSIAVATATGGMGVAAMGGTASTLGGVALTATTATGAITTTAMGAAVNAGFASLAAQASVVLVNNGGDIGKTLEQLGSEQSIKNLLIAMGTAGVGTNVAGQGVNAVAAQTAAGCVAGAASGSGCEQGAKTAAVLSGAGEAYRTWVGYAANAAPGENRFGSLQTSQIFEPDALGRQIPADHGMNVIGLNKPGSWLSQGSALSRTLNQVPFVNATAGLHDYIFNANTDLNFTFWNVPTMLPAAMVSIPAALNNPNIYWLTQIMQPSLDLKPSAPTSIIRIGTPLSLPPTKSEERK